MIQHCGGMKPRPLILEELYRDEGGSNTLYSVALRPEIALNHWGDYTTEGIEADHHYGASI